MNHDPYQPSLFWLILAALVVLACFAGAMVVVAWLFRLVLM
jgi:hypothetical protein